MSDELTAETEVKEMNDAGNQVRDYKDLLVWQKSLALAKRVYEWTTRFPFDERFGLVAQLRRAAVSIPSNIAEGQARNTTGEFIQFISHAEGSVAELDTQVRLAADLGFMDPGNLESALADVVELQKMLKGLRRSLSAHH